MQQSTPWFKRSVNVADCMETQKFLRVEGLAVLCIALGGYFTLNGPVWWLIVLTLAPDLSMIGYLAGP